jgi:hypothetical protein
MFYDLSVSENILSTLQDDWLYYYVYKENTGKQHEKYTPSK